MPKSPAQIRRKIAENVQLIHEYELQLGHYEGRKCSNPRQTQDAINRMNQDNRVLRRDLEDAVEAERKFMKKR